MICSMSGVSQAKRCPTEFGPLRTRDIQVQYLILLNDIVYEALGVRVHHEDLPLQMRSVSEAASQEGKVTNVVARDVSESAQYDFEQVSDRLRVGGVCTHLHAERL